MHQIDSGVIISFLRAILRKFKECVENPLNIPGAAAKKLTSRLRMLLGKEKTASGHIMYGAHACLVPVNYATSNVFKQLQEKKKAARNTRACDYRHLLLLLPFILSNLFRKEVEKHNSRNITPPLSILQRSSLELQMCFCVGTSNSARLYPQRPPLIFAFCALSLIGKLLLFSLYLLFHIMHIKCIMHITCILCII
jgi:hypothetical protein